MGNLASISGQLPWFAGRKAAAFVAVTFALLLGASDVAVGQVAGFSNLWQEFTEQQVAGRLPATLKTSAQRDIVPQAYRTLVLDKYFMAQLLEAAPDESGQRSMRNGSEIILPLPEGGYGRFSVLESPLMEPELADQFPDIKNYVVQGIDDPTATGRIDTSPKGFRAMVISASGTFFIDPYWSNSDDVSICYAKKDFVSEDKMAEWTCGVVGEDSPVARAARDLSAQPRPTGASLRVYRAATAATGEYTAFHGGTVQGAMAAINTSLARVNAIYERDFCIRMVLVANNNLLVYTNASTDPYTNNDGFAMLAQNQTTVDNVIGNANYDIGHVFSTGGGGVAGLGVVCVSGQKARGVTGSSSPVGDPFDVDYVAHEIGHQFCGNHTFNADANLQWNSTTAFEPGSGSTIMAYAGIVSGQNLQRYSDDHFHTGSYTEIDNFTTTGAGSSAFQAIVTGNRPPVIAPIPGYTIPARTPFALTASATDEDGDTLTYCWEQYDVGPKQNPVTANPRDNGSSPIFRSYSPTTNATRFFPSLRYVLNNTNIPPPTYTSNGVATWATGEALPTTSRTMTFRVSVRDNRAGGGGQNWASTQVTTVGNAGPFRVSSQNTATSVSAGIPFNVTWDVAGTTAAPIGAANVRVSLSTNGGTNFPIVLAASVPNSGTASVTIPSGLDTTAGRLKVEAVGNIFYDINDANLTLLSPSVPVVRILTPPDGSNFTPGEPVSVSVQADDLQLNGQPGVIDNVALLLNGNQIVVLTSAPFQYTFVPPLVGSYTLEARATDTDGEVGRASVAFTVASAPPGTVVTAFTPPTADGPVQALAADAVGRIYIGGNFTKLNGTVHAPKIARLRSNGLPDVGFFFPGGGANAQVRALAYSRRDAALYVGGTFTAYDGLTRRALAKVAIGQPGKNDGALDATFDAQIEGSVENGAPHVQTIVVQPDGKILVGGSFARVLGQDRANLVRFLPDGSLDATFAPNPNGPVNAIALQPDGKIVIGGAFSSLNGVPGFQRLARLNLDGSFDPSLVTGTGLNGPVNALAVTLDGDILVGGQFTAYGPFSSYNRMVKLSSVGVLDRKFNAAPGFDNEVNDILLRSTGSLLVSGYFASVGNEALRSASAAVGRVLQLNTGGVVDTGFNPGQSGANGPITDTIALPSGDILLAGAFSSFNGTPRQSLAVVTGFSTDKPGLTSQPFRNISAGEDLEEFFTASAAGAFTLVDSNGNVQPPAALLPRGVTFDAVTGRLSGIPLDAGVHNIYIRFAPSATASLSSVTRFLLHVNQGKVSYGQWKRAWFTNPSDLADDSISGPGAVRNGVGANNMLVYAVDGGSPVTMDGTRLPTVGLERFDRRDYLTLKSPKYPGARAILRPEFSATLASWSSAADQLSVTNTGTGVVARPVVPADEAESQFLRLKILPE
jgi:uncharacterized delta-60 repeat protein